VINEVQYDPIQAGGDAAFEWLELLNRTAWTVDLTGWGIADNYGVDYIASLQLPPGGFAVIAAGDGFYDDFPDFSGDIVFIADGRVGNGLNNGGDRLVLTDSTGKTIDALSYGDDASIMSPPCQGVAEGHSLERQPAGLDTDQASDFVDNGAPSPGYGLEFAATTSTPIPTPTPGPTATPILAPVPRLTPTPMPTPTPTPTLTPVPIVDELAPPQEIEWWLVVSTIAGAAFIGLAVFYVARRRGRG